MQGQRGERRNVVGDDPDAICMQRPKEHCRKNCLRSIETGSGASQPPTQGGIHERCHEALSEDGKMILLINRTSIGREGAS